MKNSATAARLRAPRGAIVEVPALQRPVLEGAMEVHALAAAQHVWDCRYSQLTYRLSPENEPDHRETLWVCFRDPGPRRPVSEEECSTCPRWELDPNNRVKP